MIVYFVITSWLLQNVLGLFGKELELRETADSSKLEIFKKDDSNPIKEHDPPVFDLLTSSLILQKFSSKTKNIEISCKELMKMKSYKLRFFLSNHIAN